MLALVEYLAYVEALEGAPPDKVDFSLSDHLDRAIGHATRALEIRESDADLYRMRALLHLGRAAIPLRVFLGNLPSMHSADRGALKAL